MALLTECRLLSNSSAIKMTLLRSEEEAESSTFDVRSRPAHHRLRVIPCGFVDRVFRA